MNRHDEIIEVLTKELYKLKNIFKKETTNYDIEICKNHFSHFSSFFFNQSMGSKEKFIRDAILIYKIEI